MKVLVVLCAVVASCLAKPYGYIGTVSAPISYSSHVVSVASPFAYPAAPAYAPAYAAAPAYAQTYAAAPAYAPAYAAAPAYALPATRVVAAPAPVVAAAPAPAVAYAAAPAPAPVVAYAAGPAVVAAAPVAAATKTQYHAQNELGEASYGHSEPGQTHNAVQDAHGNKVGSFSYVNPEGQVLRTDYVADGAGYRVASNALPAAPIVAPIDTPEVAAAKAAFHNEYALRAAPAHLRRRRSLTLVQTPASTSPLAAPVVYSAPVAHAVAPAVAYGAPAVAYGAPAVAYSAPAVAYSAPAVAYSAPAVTYSSPAVAYSAPAVAPIAPVAHALPASRLATLTTVVNNPGHAVSYRVD